MNAPGVGALACLPVFFGAAGPLGAAPPTLEALFPSGGQAGSEIAALTIVGKAEPWPGQVWCSNPGVTFTPGEKPGIYRVAIAREAATGPCLVRLFNADGASEPQTFVVSRLREIVEDEKVPNENPAQATAVGDLPVVVNGRLEKAPDFDAWKVSLKKGQVLHARIDGYSLRTGIDPFLHLYDATGARLELASDGPTNLDPRIVHEAGRDGDYVVGVMAIANPPAASVAFFGAPKAAYRLTLTVGPVDPAVAGVGYGEAPGQDTLPPAGGAATVPLNGFGTLSKPGETDRILFQAAKGQSLLIRADAVGHGFPTDPVLIVEKADGALIREIDDDKANRDAVFSYAVPADGEYACRVTDRFHRGGPDLRYSLEIREQSPDFSPTADLSFYTGKAGETVQVKLKIERREGHSQPLVAMAEGLPAGVTTQPLNWDAKAAEGTLELKIGEGVPPFSGPFQVSVSGESGGKRLVRPAVFSFQNADARGSYLIDGVADLWLTIPPKAEKKE